MERDLTKETPQYYYDVEQGTERWYDLRMGRVTASQSKEILVAGKSASGLGAGALTLAVTKAAEFITKEDPYYVSNQHTERGHELEPLAVEDYEEETFNETTVCGFITLGESCGYSPDRLVGEDGLLEVKCPQQKEYLRILDGGKDKPEYISQVQYGLWVSGREWCDLVYFHPKFKKKRVIKRITRDEVTIAKFIAKIPRWKEEFDRLVNLDKDE